ncbi:MAG: redoxin domain-containing protein [Sedimentisphaerales bacterium]|nr:redoxin domain-containing protein [Sedimentisphaerales bacterium]
MFAQHLRTQIEKTNIMNGILKEKDRVPRFKLPNVEGKPVCSREMLSGGKLVITFYGRSWRPYCGLELMACQAVYEVLEKRNVKFIAISPHEPGPASLKRGDINLTYETLVDVDNKVAKQFGLTFEVPGKEVKKFRESFCIDLVSMSSGDHVELSIPATYIVNKDGTILKSFFGLDNLSHPNPKEILKYLD